MKTRTVIFFCVVAALGLAACGESEGTDWQDIAHKVSGTYYGEYFYSGAGTEEAYVTLSWLTDSTVTLKATVSGTPLYSYPVKLTPESNGTVTLLFERFNILLVGAIDGNEMGYSHNFNSFIGTR